MPTPRETPAPKQTLGRKQKEEETKKVQAAFDEYVVVSGEKEEV
jgi:hypothetical protein